MQADTLLQGLNDKQKEAVQCTEGPVLVTAGAGSGKTRVLTRRIAYLILAKHVPSWHILALTFTNKAAKEMKKRIGKLLSGRPNHVRACTFHSLGIHILNRQADLLGYKLPCTIAGDSAQKTLVKHILKNRLGKDLHVYDPGEVLGIIGRLKDEIVLPEQYAKKIESQIHIADKTMHQINDVLVQRQTVAKTYKIYQQTLKNNQEMDFNDLIMLPVVLFKRHPDILKHYQEKFRYISVDEYQDTNEAQYQMVSLLARRYSNLCVVGDADQSIYGWRGADIRNILNFKIDYPKAHVIYMQQNYRSTQNILDAANAVIKKNKHKHPKKLWTDNPKGQKVIFHQSFDSPDEAKYVSARIQQLVAKYNLHYNDFAVLYRANRQSKDIGLQFTYDQIPYVVVGGMKFLQTKEIRDALAYLTLVITPDDSLKFTRVINTPKRGIGQTSVNRLAVFAHLHHESLFQAALTADQVPKLSSGAESNIVKFVGFITHAQSVADHHSIGYVLHNLLQETGYVPKLKKEASTLKTAHNRLLTLKAFMEMVAKFDTTHQNLSGKARISSFLNRIALQSAQDASNQSKDNVEIMTVHAAKGLEFPIVFMIGMNDGTFPAYYSGNKAEERRIAYVAITRAEKMLFMTYVSGDRSYTSGGSFRDKNVSPYLTDIPMAYRESDREFHLHSQPPEKPKPVANPFAKKPTIGQEVAETAHHIPNDADRQEQAKAKIKAHREHMKKLSASRAGIKWFVGQSIEHDRWGKGVIKKINNTGKFTFLKIYFPNAHANKNIIANVAPIHPLS